MDKFGVQLHLINIADARSAWSSGYTKLNEDIAVMMRLLLHEAAKNRMSIEDVAHYSGYPTKKIREWMRMYGLDPKASRNLLSHRAAKALEENADLMGVRPQDMDLMSPLAYLPMGSELKAALRDDKERELFGDVSGNGSTE